MKITKTQNKKQQKLPEKHEYTQNSIIYSELAPITGDVTPF